LLTRDTDTRVANVDAHVLTRTAAANENPAFGFSIFYSVADQISENAIEKHRIARDGCASGAHTDVDPLLERAFRILIAGLPKQGFECDGREMSFLGVFIEAHGSKQLIELPIEAIDRVLAPLQQILLRVGPDADAEKFVGALDDLQRLSKIMTNHGEEHGLKVGCPLWVCPVYHSQGSWLLGRPRDAGPPGDSRKPSVCVGHDVLSSSQGLALDDLVVGKRFTQHRLGREFSVARRCKLSHSA
jgi:hypothetical protein